MASATASMDENNTFAIVAKSSSTSKILNLNDDCLREICEHFDLSDLCAFADVCTRFKQNAQAHFCSKKLGDIQEFDWMYLQNGAQYLRNFGTSISSLTVDMLTYSYYRKFFEHGLEIKQEAIIDLILRYCDEALTALDLSGLKVSEETILKLQPLLFRLRKLKISNCNFVHLSIRMLQTHLPELRELTLEAFGYGDRIGTFPKLEMFSIGHFCVNEFKHILEKNQQLKSIELRYGFQYDEVFDVLAECIPSIEYLSISYKFYTIPSVVTLRKMTALKKFVIKDSNALLFSRMGEAQIPIEFLEIQDFESKIDLMGSISQLEKIETLRLVDVSEIKQTLFLQMCNHLSNLTELYLLSKCRWNADVLLKIAENAKNLQLLYAFMPVSFPHKSIIDVDMYTKLVDIVKGRSEKQYLKIILLDKLYSINVPKEIRNAYKHLLTVEIVNFPGEMKRYNNIFDAEFNSSNTNDDDYYNPNIYFGHGDDDYSD